LPVISYKFIIISTKLLRGAVNATFNRLLRNLAAPKCGILGDRTNFLHPSPSELNI